MAYSLLRPLLFHLEPELAHRFSLDALKTLDCIGCLPRQTPLLPCTVMGIHFPNPFGVAAGLDKNGDYIQCLAALGFGFVEVGTVTPKPQSGNPKPRVFRIPEAQAMINRLGFNSKGLEYCATQIEKARYKGVLGVNIGKNKDTSIENSVSDYLLCLRRMYPLASYITVNISSPNTADLRNLQHGEYLNHLLSTLKAEQTTLADHYGRYVPLVLKIAPDLTRIQVEEVASALIAHKMDGVVATNTTVSREKIMEILNEEGVDIEGYQHDLNIAGGVSGKPLFTQATQILKWLSHYLDGQIPIIGVGGILNGEDAVAKYKAGAQLLQVYTGFVYRGPGLVREVMDALEKVKR